MIDMIIDNREDSPWSEDAQEDEDGWEDVTETEFECDIQTVGQWCGGHNAD